MAWMQSGAARTAIGPQTGKITVGSGVKGRKILPTSDRNPFAKSDKCPTIRFTPRQRTQKNSKSGKKGLGSKGAQKGKWRGVEGENPEQSPQDHPANKAPPPWLQLPGKTVWPKLSSERTSNRGGKGKCRHRINSIAKRGRKSSPITPRTYHHKKRKKRKEMAEYLLQIPMTGRRQGNGMVRRPKGWLAK